MVHFIVSWQQHCVEKPVTWLVPSTETNRPMFILLAISTGTVVVVPLAVDAAQRFEVRGLMSMSSASYRGRQVTSTSA